VAGCARVTSYRAADRSQPACMKRSCQRHTQVFDLSVRRMISIGTDAVDAQQDDLSLPDVLMRALRSHASVAKRRRSAGLRVMQIPFASPRHARNEPAGKPCWDSNVRFDPLAARERTARLRADYKMWAVLASNHHGAGGPYRRSITRKTWTPPAPLAPDHEERPPLHCAQGEPRCQLHGQMFAERRAEQFRSPCTRQVAVSQLLWADPHRTTDDRSGRQRHVG
jgi:hypothetical protein